MTQTMKKKAQHTQGEWTYSMGHHQSYDHFDATITVGEGRERKVIARLPELGDESTHFESVSNARLLAAAPELFAACERLITNLDEGHKLIGAFEQIRFALNKAKEG